MPILNTPGGPIRFKSVALYPGVKQIDKAMAAENLKILKNVLGECGVEFQLAFGSLLGAVREHDFIDHDEDIDLAFLDEDRDKVLAAMPRLYDAGFKVCRYDRRDLVSIMRKGEYIDLYFYRPYGDGLRICSGSLLIENHLVNSTTLDFKGDTYNIPARWEEYLVGVYGKDWRTPVKWNDYSMPASKVAFFEFKEKLKELLPDSIFMLLARRAQKKLEAKCKARLKRNLNYPLQV